jgi:hypothetical protein
MNYELCSRRRKPFQYLRWWVVSSCCSSLWLLRISYGCQVHQILLQLRLVPAAFIYFSPHDLEFGTHQLSWMPNWKTRALDHPLNNTSSSYYSIEKKQCRWSATKSVCSRRNPIRYLRSAILDFAEALVVKNSKNELLVLIQILWVTQ